MLPSVRRTLKVSNDYSADINKLSYFLRMPAQQKGKCTERTARLYLTLTLGIINGMQSICEECFICRIFVYLLCLVFIYTARLVACPACGTEVKIQGLAFTEQPSGDREPDESSMKQCPTKILTEQKTKRIWSSNVWAKMDSGWLSERVCAELAAIKTYLQL